MAGRVVGELAQQRVAQVGLGGLGRVLEAAMQVWASSTMTSSGQCRANSSRRLRCLMKSVEITRYG